MSEAIPYSITVRDPEVPGARPGEHEVCFSTGERPHQHITSVVRLTDRELVELAAACNGRIVTQTIMRQAAGKGVFGS